MSLHVRSTSEIISGPISNCLHQEPAAMQTKFNEIIQVQGETTSLLMSNTYLQTKMLAHSISAPLPPTSSQLSQARPAKKPGQSHIPKLIEELLDLEARVLRNEVQISVFKIALAEHMKRDCARRYIQIYDILSETLKSTLGPVYSDHYEKSQRYMQSHRAASEQ